MAWLELQAGIEVVWQMAVIQYLERPHTTRGEFVLQLAFPSTVSVPTRCTVLIQILASGHCALACSIVLDMRSIHHCTLSSDKGNAVDLESDVS